MSNRLSILVGSNNTLGNVMVLEEKNLVNLKSLSKIFFLFGMYVLLTTHVLDIILSSRVLEMVLNYSTELRPNPGSVSNLFISTSEKVSLLQTSVHNCVMCDPEVTLDESRNNHKKWKNKNKKLNQNNSSKTVARESDENVANASKNTSDRKSKKEKTKQKKPWGNPLMWDNDPNYGGDSNGGADEDSGTWNGENILPVQIQGVHGSGQSGNQNQDIVWNQNQKHPFNKKLMRGSASKNTKPEKYEDGVTDHKKAGKGSQRRRHKRFSKGKKGLLKDAKKGKNTRAKGRGQKPRRKEGRDSNNSDAEEKDTDAVNTLMDGDFDLMFNAKNQVQLEEVTAELTGTEGKGIDPDQVEKIIRLFISIVHFDEDQSDAETDEALVDVDGKKTDDAKPDDPDKTLAKTDLADKSKNADATAYATASEKSGKVGAGNDGWSDTEKSDSGSKIQEEEEAKEEHEDVDEQIPDDIKPTDSPEEIRAKLRLIFPSEEEQKNATESGSNAPTEESGANASADTQNGSADADVGKSNGSTNEGDSSTKLGDQTGQNCNGGNCSGDANSENDQTTTTVAAGANCSGGTCNADGATIESVGATNSKPNSKPRNSSSEQQAKPGLKPEDATTTDQKISPAVSDPASKEVDTTDGLKAKISGSEKKMTLKKKLKLTGKKSDWFVRNAEALTKMRLEYDGKYYRDDELWANRQLFFLFKQWFLNKVILSLASNLIKLPLLIFASIPVCFAEDIELLQEYFGILNGPSDERVKKSTKEASTMRNDRNGVVQRLRGVAPGTTSVPVEGRTPSLDVRLPIPSTKNPRSLSNDNPRGSMPMKPRKELPEFILWATYAHTWKDKEATGVEWQSEKDKTDKEGNTADGKGWFSGLSSCLYEWNPYYYKPFYSISQSLVLYAIYPLFIDQFAYPSLQNFHCISTIYFHYVRGFDLDYSTRWAEKYGPRSWYMSLLCLENLNVWSVYYYRWKRKLRRRFLSWWDPVYTEADFKRTESEVTQGDSKIAGVVEASDLNVNAPHRADTRRSSDENNQSLLGQPKNYDIFLEDEFGPDGLGEEDDEIQVEDETPLAEVSSPMNSDEEEFLKSTDRYGWIQYRAKRVWKNSWKSVRGTRNFIGQCVDDHSKDNLTWDQESTVRKREIIENYVTNYETKIYGITNKINTSVSQNSLGKERESVKKSVPSGILMTEDAHEQHCNDLLNEHLPLPEGWLKLHSVMINNPGYYRYQLDCVNDGLDKINIRLGIIERLTTLCFDAALEEYDARLKFPPYDPTGGTLWGSLQLFHNSFWTVGPNLRTTESAKSDTSKDRLSRSRKQLKPAPGELHRSDYQNFPFRIAGFQDVLTSIEFDMLLIRGKELERVIQTANEITEFVKSGPDSSEEGEPATNKKREIEHLAEQDTKVDGYDESIDNENSSLQIDVRYDQSLQEIRELLKHSISESLQTQETQQTMGNSEVKDLDSLRKGCEESLTKKKENRDLSDSDLFFRLGNKDCDTLRTEVVSVLRKLAEKSKFQKRTTWPPPVFAMSWLPMLLSLIVKQFIRWMCVFLDFQNSSVTTKQNLEKRLQFEINENKKKQKKEDKKKQQKIETSSKPGFTTITPSDFSAKSRLQYMDNSSRLCAKISKELDEFSTREMLKREVELLDSHALFYEFSQRRHDEFKLKNGQSPDGELLNSTYQRPISLRLFRRKADPWYAPKPDFEKKISEMKSFTQMELSSASEAKLPFSKTSGEKGLLDDPRRIYAQDYNAKLKLYPDMFYEVTSVESFPNFETFEMERRKAVVKPLIKHNIIELDVAASLGSDKTEKKKDLAIPPQNFTFKEGLLRDIGHKLSDEDTNSKTPMTVKQMLKKMGANSVRQVDGVLKIDLSRNHHQHESSEYYNRDSDVFAGCFTPDQDPYVAVDDEDEAAAILNKQTYFLQWGKIKNIYRDYKDDEDEENHEENHHDDPNLSVLLDDDGLDDFLSNLDEEDLDILNGDQEDITERLVEQFRVYVSTRIRRVKRFTKNWFFRMYRKISNFIYTHTFYKLYKTKIYKRYLRPVYDKYLAPFIVTPVKKVLSTMLEHFGFARLIHLIGWNEEDITTKFQQVGIEFRKRVSRGKITYEKLTRKRIFVPNLSKLLIRFPSDEWTVRHQMELKEKYGSFNINTQLFTALHEKYIYAANEIIKYPENRQDIILITDPDVLQTKMKQRFAQDPDRKLAREFDTNFSLDSARKEVRIYFRAMEEEIVQEITGLASRIGVDQHEFYHKGIRQEGLYKFLKYLFSNIPNVTVFWIIPGILATKCFNRLFGTWFAVKSILVRAHHYDCYFTFHLHIVESTLEYYLPKKYAGIRWLIYQLSYKLSYAFAAVGRLVKSGCWNWFTMKFAPQILPFLQALPGRIRDFMKNYCTRDEYEFLKTTAVDYYRRIANFIGFLLVLAYKALKKASDGDPAEGNHANRELLKSGLYSNGNDGDSKGYLLRKKKAGKHDADDGHSGRGGQSGKGKDGGSNDSDGNSTDSDTWANSRFSNDHSVFCKFLRKISSCIRRFYNIVGESVWRCRNLGIFFARYAMGFGKQVYVYTSERGRKNWEILKDLWARCRFCGRFCIVGWICIVIYRIIWMPCRKHIIRCIKICMRRCKDKHNGPKKKLAGSLCTCQKGMSSQLP